LQNVEVNRITPLNKLWASLRTAQQEAEKPIAESGGKM